MKQLIIIAIIILMSGVVLAHDPNSLPPEKAWQLSVNNDGIATMDFRFSQQQFYVWKQGGIRAARIAESIQISVVKEVKAYWKKMWEAKTWQQKKAMEK